MKKCSWYLGLVSQGASPGGGLQAGPPPADAELVGPFTRGFEDSPGVVVHEALQRTAVDGQELIPHLDEPRQLCSTSCGRGAQHLFYSSAFIKDTLHDFDSINSNKNTHTHSDLRAKPQEIGQLLRRPPLSPQWFWSGGYRTSSYAKFCTHFRNIVTSQCYSS